MNLVRKIRVLVELILGLRKPIGLIEVGDRYRLLEILDDFRRLIGKAVALVGSEIVGLVVAIGQYVRDGDDCQRNENVGACE